MVAVADLERFLERVFERTSARLFRSRIQAVQVERRVERAMEAGRSGRGASTTVPNRYRVRLNPTDLDDLARRTGGFEALAVRLADNALAFARLHAYHLAARPMVSVVADPSVEAGRVEVDTGEAPAAVPAPGLDDDALPVVLPPVVAPAVAVAPVLASPSASPPAAALGAALGAEAQAGPASAPSAEPPVFVPLPTSEAGPAQAAVIPPLTSPTVTPEHRIRAGDRPYEVRPVPPPPHRAMLRVVEPGGREREVRVEGQPLTLGRAPDNGLVIADARVSRHHGRFQARHGTLVYTDLGSTNGTRVNGIRVDEIVLGPGDRLQVGDVVVVVEHLPR